MKAKSNKQNNTPRRQAAVLSAPFSAPARGNAPDAPPVYRPQTAVRQMKAGATNFNPGGRPAPPPVYRPQLSAPQMKVGVNPSAGRVSAERPVVPTVPRLAPPVYRPSPPVSRLQPNPANLRLSNAGVVVPVVVQPSWRGMLWGGAIGLGLAAAAAATVATGGLAAIAAGGLATLGAAASTVTGAVVGNSVDTLQDNLASTIGQGLSEGLAEGAADAIEMLSPWKPIFHNNQSPEFLSELQEFQEHQSAVAHIADEAFICKFDTNLVPDPRIHNPGRFKRLVRTRRKFLWTYDVGGILSVGSPQHNKHAIVADNAQLYAAGTGQIKTSPEVDRYLSYLYLENKAQTLLAQGFTDQKSNPYIEMAKAQKISKPASLDSPEDRVVLDFDSGHYHPQGAWKAAYEAWIGAGFSVEKSSTSRRIV